MKTNYYLTIVLFLGAVFIASKCKDKSVGLDTCKNLPNIAFMDEAVGTDKEKTFKMLTDLAAAAKNDAALSKTIEAQASLNVKSDLGRKLNQNVKASQKVSEDFWEQNITFTQLLCFTEGQTKRQDLSKKEKEEFSTLLRQILSDRNEYLKQRGAKKNPSLAPK
jgi:hypothetical protein